MNLFLVRILFVAVGLFSGSAFAHPEHLHLESSAQFMDGLWHPFTGIDHLLAMLTVGIYAAMSARKNRDALWAPFIFASFLVAGACLALSGIHLPLVEPMVAVSVLVLGLLLASRKILAPVLGLPLIASFALFHGLAHGTEIPGLAGPSDALPFLGGMLLATLLLHTCGLGIGFLFRQQRGHHWLRLTGAVFSMAGLGLLLRLV